MARAKRKLNTEGLIEKSKGRKQRIKETVGEDADHLSRLDTSTVLTAYQDGVLVNLHVRWWRGYKTLTPEDLGMRPTAEAREFLKKAVNLGGKRMLPARTLSRLKSLEVLGRQALNTYSFNTFYGSFVPCTVYEDWKTEYERLRKEFLSIRDDIYENYDDIVEEMRAMWLENAPTLYRMANRKKLPDGYAEETADRIVSQIRSREEIYQSFQYEQALTLVPIPSEAKADLLEAEHLERISRYGKDRANQLESFQHDLESEFSQRKQRMTDFVSGIQGQISEEICKMASEVHNAIQGKGTVYARTATKLRRLVDKARSLNFIQDPSVEEWLSSVDKVINNAEVTPEELSKVLRTVSSAARNELDEVKKEDPSFSLVLSINDETP